jgi:hypothetical protein
VIGKNKKNFWCLGVLVVKTLVLEVFVDQDRGISVWEWFQPPSFDGCPRRGVI